MSRRSGKDRRAANEGVTQKMETYYPDGIVSPSKLRRWAHEIRSALGRRKEER